MSLWKIAWRSIQQRVLASTLTGISMALGVMLVVVVLTAYAVIKQNFNSGRALPYNMIIGAKGGDLQMVLNTVYYLDKPVENLPYTYYEEFLPKSQRKDGRDGEFSDSVEAAIPVCMGDYYRNFRVIGTTPQFFEDVGPPYKIHYAFSAGENFHQDHYFDAVVGAFAAQQAEIHVGSKLKISHGVEGGHIHDQPFTVVGVLAPTGTPVDRGVFINMEGDFRLDGHVGSRKEVTCVLVRTARIPGMENLPEGSAEELRSLINKGTVARAVMPISEITRFFNRFVDPLLMLFLFLAVLIVIVSGIGILVSIYNSMSERKHEIAVMRALGAGRSTVMRIVLFESILLSLGGGLLGWFTAHSLIAIASPWITSQTGLFVQILQSGAIYELILVPGLILLAALVGFLPALAAYRTDVAKALTATP
ncbi:MAG TPA: ABC transporter permease [Pirellulales bacterium]|jgi:putative ABC transport system permease protein|nr:ABC transporter permease [Pirellulales bacterium]